MRVKPRVWYVGMIAILCIQNTAFAMIISQNDPCDLSGYGSFSGSGTATETTVCATGSSDFPLSYALDGGDRSSRTSTAGTFEVYWYLEASGQATVVHKDPGGTIFASCGGDASVTSPVFSGYSRSARADVNATGTGGWDYDNPGWIAGAGRFYFNEGQGLRVWHRSWACSGASTGCGGNGEAVGHGHTDCNLSQ